MKFYLLIFTLILSGCATQVSSLKQSGKTEIYKLGEKEMFQIIYDVMSNNDSNLIVKEITGVERGYEVMNTFGIDYRKTTVRVIPLEGIDIKGNKIKGYYYTIDERANTPFLSNNIIENIKIRLNKTNTKVSLTKFWKTNYEYERDGLRLNKKPSAREKAPDVATRLLKLKLLFDEKIITKKEYEAKRKSILSEL